MNRTQYLLCKIAEEASEIAQIALKAQQFGLNERLSYTSLTNGDRLNAEIIDLVACLSLLEEEGVEFSISDMSIIDKASKVAHYMKYSQELGLVSRED